MIRRAGLGRPPAASPTRRNRSHGDVAAQRQGARRRRLQTGALTSAELYTSDGGGELTLVSAASRKKHGNAGTFDIDLPLTGTPGVECRVGNGGTFLQTIVFTFSEAVTSVSGTTTTTCGSVNSTTISGSTVTVELGHVTCDGSDITVTVPGVNGASGSVDASATMTLRTGDVNADGVVGNG